MIQPNRYLRRLGLTLLLLLAAQSGTADSIRIMPVGDRDTEGFGGFVSYRYDLWFLLKDAGHDVDFVGRSSAVGGNFQADLYPKYEEFDPDHEGRATTPLSDFASTAVPMVSINQPDVVLLMGSIDICQSGSGAATIARIELPKIIDSMRAVDPDIHFLLGQAYPWESQHCDPNAPQIIPDFNEAWAEVATDKDTPGSRVLLVDHYSGFNNGSMLSQGGWAANRQGEMFLAENWFQALEEVLPLVDADTFSINAGHSGAWYNPATAGQGQLIDVAPASQFLFLSWFTFTGGDSSNPDEQHWFTAQGNYSDDTADLVVYETLGGRLDDPQAVSTEPVGTATLNFNDCGNGQLDYAIDSWNIQGSFPLLRAIPGTENVCEELSEPGTASLQPNDGRDGAWFDENTPGQGFLIDAHPNADGDDFIFVAWFTYGDGTASGQRWLTAQGPLVGSTADLVVYETLGGRFDDPQPSETSAVGSMTIDFTDCSNALLTYSITDEALTGMIDIKRAIPGTEALCLELTGEE